MLCVLTLCVLEFQYFSRSCEDDAIPILSWWACIALIGEDSVKKNAMGGACGKHGGWET
jgi:hypothetical protein